MIFSFLFLHAFICSAVSHPGDRWTLGVPELHRTLPEHHLQYPAVWGDQCFRTGGWLDRRRTESCWDPARPTDLVLHVLTRPSFSWLWSTLDLWPAPSSQPQGSSSPSSAQFFCLATPWTLCSGPAPSWSSSVRVTSHIFEVQLIGRCPRLSQFFHSLVLSLQVLDSMLNLANPPRRRHIESSSLREVAREKHCTSRKRYNSQTLISWPRPAADKRASDLFKYSSYFLCLKDGSGRQLPWLLLIRPRDILRGRKS